MHKFSLGLQHVVTFLDCSSCYLQRKPNSPMIQYAEELVPFCQHPQKQLESTLTPKVLGCSLGFRV